MGTNYYLYEQPQYEHCGRGDEPLHIGKSSGGWCFSLHIIPDLEILDLPDWMVLWEKQGVVIRDEYDSTISADEMIDCVTNRSWGETIPQNSSWYRENSAVQGPNNLARHKIDGIHCTGHGDGTWDLITGEFS